MILPRLPCMSAGTNIPAGTQPATGATQSVAIRTFTYQRLFRRDRPLSRRSLPRHISLAHQRFASVGIVAVFHVAELDENRRILSQVQAREIGAAVEAVRTNVGGRLQTCGRPANRASRAPACTAGPPCAAFSGGLE